MKNFRIAALAAAVGIAAAAPAWAVQTPSAKNVACSDIAGLVAIVQGLGYAPQVKTAQGQSGIFFATHGSNVIGMTPLSAPDFGGCFGLLFLSPFAADSGGNAGLYNKFNSSILNGFGATAGTFQGHSVLAHSMITKFGTPGGNLEMEIELFAERADLFAKALSTGAVAMDESAPSLPNAANGLASLKDQGAANAAVEKAMHSLMNNEEFANPQP